MNRTIRNLERTGCGLIVGLMALTSVAAQAGDAVVAVSHPLAAAAGAWAIDQGGDAVDAAAAIQFALNVVEPQSSGIGGGAFIMVYRAKTQQVFALDAREVAPAAASAEQFAGMDFEQASTNGIAVGVPGTLAGMEALRQRWGHLTLAQSLKPARRYARDGFQVTPYLAHAMQSRRLDGQPEARQLVRNQQGQVLTVGALWRQPELAHTFDLIARDGVNAFYKGAMARAMVRAQQRSHVGPAGVGRLTLSDLADYRPLWRKPLEYSYRGYRLVSMPPPSSGGVALFQVLGMLSRFQVGQQPGMLLGESGQVRVTIDALRLALSDRARWMGDAPSGLNVPMAQLLSPAYLEAQSRRLDPQHRLELTPEHASPEGTHTTHFSVVDHEGNVVSVTSTVEAPWGSGILVPGYGFFLNNELTDFNLTPHANAQDPGVNDVRPQHRPRSSMTPTLLFRGARWIGAYGSPGGVSIISTVLEMTQDLLDQDLAPADAIALPRFAVLDAQGTLFVEPTFSKDLATRLRQQGDDIKVTTTPLGSVQWVGRDDKTGQWVGAADARREGTVLLIPER